MSGRVRLGDPARRTDGDEALAEIAEDVLHTRRAARGDCTAGFRLLTFRGEEIAHVNIIIGNRGPSCVTLVTVTR